MSFPAEIIYDLFNQEKESSHDLLPTFRVNRGPINFSEVSINSSKNARYLQMAMGVATTSKCRMKHGALVIHHGKILGSATNITKNSPVYVDWKDSSVHAEVRAIKRAGFPKNATVVVARVNGSGKSRLSKPCDSCMDFIRNLGYKVIWTTGDEE